MASHAPLHCLVTPKLSICAVTTGHCSPLSSVRTPLSTCAAIAGHCSPLSSVRTPVMSTCAATTSRGSHLSSLRTPMMFSSAATAGRCSSLSPVCTPMRSTHIAGQCSPLACAMKCPLAAPSHSTLVQKRFVSPQVVVPQQAVVSAKSAVAQSSAVCGLPPGAVQSSLGYPLQERVAQSSAVCEAPAGAAQSVLGPSPQEPKMSLNAQGESTQKWLQSLPRFTPPTWSGRLPVPDSPEHSPFEESHATNQVLSCVSSWTWFEQDRHNNDGECASVQKFSAWPIVVDGCPNLLAETLETLPSALLLEQLQTAKTYVKANDDSAVDSLATTISAHSNAMHDSEYCFDHTGLSNTQPLFPEAVLGAALTSGPRTTGLSGTHLVLPQVVSLATSIDITPHQKWRSPPSEP